MLVCLGASAKAWLCEQDSSLAGAARCPALGQLLDRCSKEEAVAETLGNLAVSRRFPVPRPW